MTTHTLTPILRHSIACTGHLRWGLESASLCDCAPDLLGYRCTCGAELPPTADTCPKERVA